MLTASSRSTSARYNREVRLEMPELNMLMLPAPLNRLSVTIKEKKSGCVAAGTW